MHLIVWLEFNTVRNENKLGSEVYESWLKKDKFIEEIIITFYYQFQQDLLETGLLQDI